MIFIWQSVSKNKKCLFLFFLSNAIPNKYININVKDTRTQYTIIKYTVSLSIILYNVIL